MASKKTRSKSTETKTVNDSNQEEVTTIKTKKQKSSTEAKQTPNPSPRTPPVQPTVSTGSAGDAPPTEQAPSPPAGWQPTPVKGRRRGVRPKAAQISFAAKSAKELGSSTTFVEDFGAKAPDPATIAQALANAAQWRTAWVAAKLWLAYTSEQRGVWEQEGLVQMGALEPAFDYSTTRDPSVAQKYPATTRYISATERIAERSVATKREDAAAKKKAANATPPAPNGSGTPAK